MYMKKYQKIQRSIAATAAVLLCAGLTAAVPASAEETVLMTETFDTSETAAAAEKVEIGISSAEGDVGSKVDVTVTWNASVPFSSAQVKVKYDPEIMTYADEYSIPDDSDLKKYSEKDLHFELSSEENGVLYVTYLNLADATLNNANITFTFTLKGEGTSAVEIDPENTEIFDANDQKLEVSGNSGSVTAHAQTTTSETTTSTTTTTTTTTTTSSTSESTTSTLSSSDQRSTSTSETRNTTQPGSSTSATTATSRTGSTTTTTTTGTGTTTSTSATTTYPKDPIVTDTADRTPLSLILTGMGVSALLGMVFCTKKHD